MSHAYLNAAASSTYQFCCKVPMSEVQARRVAAGKPTIIRGDFAPKAHSMKTKGLHAYRCDRCPHWHVGHQPGTSLRYL